MTAGGRIGDARRNGTKLRPDPDVVAESVGEETVVVHLRTNRIFVFNLTATRLWDLLEDHRDREAIEASFLAEFAVDRERLREDIDAFIPVLLEEELLRVDARD